MRKKLANPFVTGGYIAPEYFCDWHRETDHLLKAIAIENKVDKPTAGAFIQKHRLVSASSVKISLKSLSDKEMIALSGNAWQGYDVFLHDGWNITSEKNDRDTQERCLILH